MQENQPDLIDRQIMNKRASVVQICHCIHRTRGPISVHSSLRTLANNFLLSVGLSFIKECGRGLDNTNLISKMYR